MFGQKKKNNYFYEAFADLCHFPVECGEYILNFMKNFDHSKLEETKVNVHRIEHLADDKKHEATKKLMEEFMTPIDREDILQLLNMIDDVTDAIEEVSLKMFLYDYSSLPPDTIPFMELTVECIKKTETLMRHFSDFLNPEAINPYVQGVVHMEEESDTEYINDVSALYRSGADFMAIKRGEEMYSMLEETADRCREVCKFTQTIIYKNL
jgi:predicted phosphate transport protein (TIGR00153 family)